MPSNFFLQGLPHHISTFTYDAIVALGLSACDAINSTENNPVFSSKEHRDSFAAKRFRGASGDFVLRDNFPTRTADSSYFVMVNMKENELNDTHVSFKGSPLAYYWDSDSRQWENHKNVKFVYADGSTTPPIELEELPDEDEDMNVLPMILVSSVSGVVLIIVVVGAFFVIKNNRADAFWQVKLNEIEFDEPPHILGRGTFGLVLMAKYRGTDVAVKRVIPPKESKKPNSMKYMTSGAFEMDIEAGHHPSKKVHFGSDGDESTEEGTNSTDQMKIHTSGLRSGSGSMSGSIKKAKGGLDYILRTIKGIDKYETLKREFIQEMRLLAKLRHPCITTVMGAVLDGVHEPMLIMECMDRGSLYDILHNKTMDLDGEIILPLLTDISQGMRFLHCAKPEVIHG